ncbi:phage tail tape measure protein [Bacillus norwichensis]|nr:phage tail tape measure protein [Bacillus norwichensis]
MASRDIGQLRTRLSWEDEGANKSLEGFRRDLKGLRSEMNLARSKGREYAQSMKGMREQSDILSRRFKTQQERVRELKKRYDESVKAKGEDANQTRDLAAQYNNAVSEMNRTEDQLNRLNKAIREQSSPWTRLGDKMTSTGEKMQEIGKGMTDFGKSYSMKVTAPIVAAGTAFFKSASEFETAFAGVRKTVDATEDQFAELKQGIRDMAKELPASANEIAGVAEVAGQLGIKRKDILKFTRVMVDLGVATNMSSEEAATALARLANITQMPMKNIDRLGATVVDLGNNLATTESEIVDMSLRLAGAGSQIGLTEDQIVAFAGALSSVGIQAEMGGSAFSRVMIEIANASAMGDKAVKDFADVAGMSAKDFQKAFKDDAALAVIAFVEGLDRMKKEGENVFGVLEDLGLSEIRVRDTLLRAAGAGDLFRESLELGSKAWEENTALTNEAAERYKTTESQLKILWNRVKDVSITLGEALIPAVMDAIDAAEPLIKKIESGAQSFSEMDKEQQATVLSLLGIVSAIGPASVALGGLTSTIGGVLKVGGNVSKMFGKVGGAGLIGRIGLLSSGPGMPVGLAIAGVGALGYGIYKLTKKSQDAKKVTTEVADSLLEQADALEPNIEKYESLQQKSGLTADEFGRLLDIQSELNKTQNPALVEQLQEEYNKLAEKSGLSNEQLDEMIELNSTIIEQAPTVEQKFTDKGNAIIESTKAVREYIDSLREMAFEELKEEQVKALEREKELRKENKFLAKEASKVEADIKELIDKRDMSLEEVNKRLQEIHVNTKHGLNSHKEVMELRREEQILLAIKNGTIAETLEKLQGERKELNKKQKLNEEELSKLDQINARMAEVLLAEVDINFEKGKGLKKLDEKIESLKNERQELMTNATEEQKRNGLYDQQIQLLDDSISKHEAIKKKILEETGYQAEFNIKQEALQTILGFNDGLLKSSLKRMLEMAAAQQGTNAEIDKGTGKAQDLTNELGKNVQKDVNVNTNPSVDALNQALSSPVRKAINLSVSAAKLALSPFQLLGYADGTPLGGHKGGAFLAGEEGFELGRLGNRWELLNFGLYDRPRGYEVFTHDESKKILRALNNLPGYAAGARDPGEANRVVNQLNNQQAMSDGNATVVRLLKDIVQGIKDGKIIQIDGNTVTRIVNENNAVDNIGRYF